MNKMIVASLLSLLMLPTLATPLKLDWKHGVFKFPSAFSLFSRSHG